MTRQSNYQDFLKLMAVITMIIDHIGLYIFHEYLIMRAIGRFAFPIFCFFAGYNFKTTPNINILIYGLILYFFQIFFIVHDFLHFNILISIFVGQCYLYFFKDVYKNFNTACAHCIIISSFWILTEYIFEYGTIVIGIMILGCYSKHSKEIKIPSLIIILIALCHTAVGFYYYFSVYEYIVLVFVIFLIYFSLNLYDFNMEISFNLLPITNHLLLIYLLNMSILMFIWRYYFII